MIEIKNIHLAFQRVLIDKGKLQIPYGQVTGIEGKSGTGKTALLEVIGLLSSNIFDYTFDGVEVAQLTSQQRNDFIRNDISFIFQDIYLFEDLTLKENIEFFASMAHQTISEEDIYEKMKFMSLHVDIHTDVKTMSIGERQRLAILCGLFKEAKLFIFDEPTAYLDAKNKAIVMDIIFRLAEGMNKMVVVATHDQELIQRIQRVYTIKDQQLILTKDHSSQEQSLEVNEHDDFQRKSLYQYVNIKQHKISYRQWFISFLLGIMISLSIFSFIYSFQYQQDSHGDLLDLLHYELIITKKNQGLISPKDYSILESQVDNPLYPVLELKGQISTQNKQHHHVKISAFHSFERMDNHLLVESKNKDCYISYPLYRKLKDTHSVIKMTYGDVQKQYQDFQVLEPQYTKDEIIYISDDDFNGILTDNQIDIYNMSLQYCKLELKGFDDIQSYVNKLDSQYTIVSPYSIETRVHMIHIFNPQMMLFIDIGVMILFTIYQIYQCIHHQNEIALLKSQGIQNKDLLWMKVYEVSQIVIRVLIISILCLLCFMMMTSSHYILLTLCLLMIHIVILYIISLFPYYYFIKRYTSAMLLRK